MARTPDFLLLKSRIKEVIDVKLYEKPRRVFEHKLDELIVRDALLRGDGVLGFCFRNKNYAKAGIKPRPRYYPRVSRHLEAELLSLLTEWNPVFEEERPLVLYYVSYVLNQSDNAMEYLTKFPSGIREYLSGLYAAAGIPIDGLSFVDAEVSESYQHAYSLLCGRVTINLLLE